MVDPADRFAACWPLTLAQECPLPNDWASRLNFSNDRHDPGGATMCGITQREYDLWRKGHGLATQPVELVSHDEGEAIYRIGYWLPHCESLPAGLDLQFFDAAVNMGTTEAVRLLQRALGIADDGIWGPQTAAAVTLSPQNLKAHIEAFTERRQDAYRSFRGFVYFGTDWLRRAQEIGAAALKMTEAL